ncbi:protein arginine methyltransferase NDUFAF7, mitochondrial isoform X2 [Phalaenopsis equestris]|uniref:protein arginine methyltransferase NDUFAF7, mitochondrial isoform X2 n=1 Tax=Phalaenopsis equestris TaxID=78828 RepID=UPI0009E38891|nr:protein arginine methyltransferase NDUFAF7, mitochondrial isoform X2 [Phalaenopsis equestris]
MLRKSVSPLLSQGIRQAIPFLSSRAGVSLSFSSSSHILNPSAPPAGQTNEHNPDSPPTATISIDRSGLYNPSDHFHKPSADSELVKHLKSIIKFRGGPISIAEYMEEVLTNPNCGFYINKDVFGAGGDFVTSPEVSQMFGEMVGVWTVCLWEQLGRPAKVNLVELGPGRGTLMADLLRGSSKFVDFSKSLDIHLVECSPTLQKLQYNTLKCIDEAISGDNTAKRITTTLTGAPILWHADLEEVPSGLPTIIIAHEFYDALPIHQFQRTSSGWTEKVVDLSDDSCSFRFVLSPQPTPASLLFLRKRCQWADKEEIAKLEQIEVCPKAIEVTQQIAKRISADGGGALIIDYGKNEIISDSLQAIRKHKFVNILDDPGSADLSAYVDFTAIRRSAEEASAEIISVYGPITQSQLLGSLGINFRVEALLQNCTEEQAEPLRAGYWRLVGDGEAPFWEGTEEQKPIGVGLRYLAMAIVNKNQGIPVPFE